MLIYDPIFTDGERMALAGFLAGYRGSTRDAYALDLRQFVAWCADHQLELFGVRRADIERYARTLEERGRGRATVARRLCTVAGFYRYAWEEGLLALSPAVHVRRPRLDYESHSIGEGSEGPTFAGCDGRRLDRHGAARVVRRVARRAGIKSRSDHTPCATPS